METTIYKLRVIVTPSKADEVIYDYLYPSKRKAIAKAQSIYAKYPLNDYVSAVMTIVFAVRIPDTGKYQFKRIYYKLKYSSK